MGIINISDIEETPKTIEELKIENKLLTEQLENINEKLKELGAVLLEGKERNVKLTFAVKLFAIMHLTSDEKMVIAQEFDRASSAEQVERIYNKYFEQVCPPGVEIERDFIWSPGFSRELEKYFFEYKGYNPFEVIENAAKNIRLHFKIEDDLSTTNDPEKIKAIKEAWQNSRESSVEAIDEIILVTNEILKK